MDFLVFKRLDTLDTKSVISESPKKYMLFEMFIVFPGKEWEHPDQLHSVHQRTDRARPLTYKYGGVGGVGHVEN